MCGKMCTAGEEEGGGVTHHSQIYFLTNLHTLNNLRRVLSSAFPDSSYPGVLTRASDSRHRRWPHVHPNSRRMNVDDVASTPPHHSRYTLVELPFGALATRLT